MNNKTKVILVILGLSLLGSCFEDKNSSNKNNNNTSQTKAMKKKKVLTTPYIEYDGAASPVKHYLKDNIADTEGLEVTSTSALFELSNGMFMQHVTFKAKNYYGTLTFNELSFLISGNGWDAQVVAADNRDLMMKALDLKDITIVTGYRETQSKEILVEVN